MMPEQEQPKSNTNEVLLKVKDSLLNFIVPLVALLATILLVALYIYPTYKSLPAKKQELEKNTTTKNTLSKKVDDLNRLVNFQSTLDENLEIVNKVLVPEPEVPRLLDQATQIAEKAGMSLEKLSYSYSSKGKGGVGFDTITVSMGVKSSLDQLVVFMELVENASRYVSVPSFRYSVSSSAKDGLGSSTFSLDSPYLFVQSAAVTDDPINLNITDYKFTQFMDKLKGLDYYDFINKDIQAEEKTVEEVATEENDQTTEETENTQTETETTFPTQ